MKIVDHRVNAGKYALKYESQEFVRDEETGKKIRDEHGQFMMRDIEEFREAQYVIGYRWLILDDDGVNRHYSTAEAVNKFGKTEFRRQKKDYLQRLRLQQIPEEDNERREQYLAHVNFERQKRGQELLPCQ